MIIWKLFFLVFCSPGRFQILEIKPKRCKGVQKRGSHLFKKSSTFLQKLTINDSPWDPQRLPKMEKTREKTFPKPNWKNAWKKHRKCSMVRWPTSTPCRGDNLLLLFLYVHFVLVCASGYTGKVKNKKGGKEKRMTTATRPKPGKLLGQSLVGCWGWFLRF